jgi:y4mF family transcriptional regulator
MVIDRNFENCYKPLEVFIVNKIAQFVRESRKAAGLTQEEFAVRSGLGLRFVRELEQGKPTVRMDKVNIALAMFGMEAVPGRKETD